MKARLIVLVLFTSLFVQTIDAREFRCSVAVNYRQLQGSGFSFLDDLSDLVEEYINKNNWTDDSFEIEEYIECSMQIIIQEALTLTSFRARLVLTSTRPIYGTTAKTTVLQINDDDWEFSFSQGTPLVFETERYDALTSVLDFYAYIMLGYDYDTFSEYGGEEWFQKAKRIQEIAASKNATGWSTLNRGRRPELATQLTEVRLRPLRQAYFKYHYEGLDHFTKDTNAARRAILDVLGTMQELYDNLSRQFVFDVFFSTKYKELVAIFERSDMTTEAYALLTEVDPSHLSTYTEMVQ